MSNVYFGLGSNVGNRKQYLERAIARLNAVTEITARSRIYESPAMLPENAPNGWNIPFLNMVVEGKTTLPPDVLMQEIKQIETALGRTQTGHWGPREIDIDLLLYGDLIMDEKGLTVPHKGITVRPFVLLPLIDIIPDYKYPATGTHCHKSLKEIATINDIHINTQCYIYEEKA